MCFKNLRSHKQITHAVNVKVIMHKTADQGQICTHVMVALSCVKNYIKT